MLPSHSAPGATARIAMNAAVGSATVAGVQQTTLRAANHVRTSATRALSPVRNGHAGSHDNVRPSGSVARIAVTHARYRRCAAATAWSELATPVSFHGVLRCCVNSPPLLPTMNHLLLGRHVGCVLQRQGPLARPPGRPSTKWRRTIAQRMPDLCSGPPPQLIARALSMTSARYSGTPW